jgi:hypothetical protein
MDDFFATHVIRIGGKRIPVHAAPGDAGGLILYTREEWNAGETTDWEYDHERGLLFQGSMTHPMLDGASIEPVRFAHVDLAVEAERLDRDGVPYEHYLNGGVEAIYVPSIRRGGVATTGNAVWSDATSMEDLLSRHDSDEVVS